VPPAPCLGQKDAVALRAQQGVAAVGVALAVKLKPTWDPEKDPVDRAGAKRPRNAAGSVGDTSEPLPRRWRGPIASQRILKLTLAGTLTGPPKVKLSSTHTSLACRVARRPSWLTVKASPGSSTAHKRPEG
jgi:hypothetical protein